MPLAPAVRTRLEKAATDTGFDLAFPAEGDWLVFGSSGARLRLWLTGYGDAVLIAALSQAHVLGAVGEHGVSMPSPLPEGAAGARGVTDFAKLDRMLRRAWQLSRTLPDEPLRVFEERTAGLPRSTEAERLVIQRVGQDIFRERLLDYWDGRCAITGLAVREVLRASHIKAWAVCETDAERLDVFNGLLLAPHLDAVFDKGLITVADDGAVLVSDRLDAEARGLLGLNGALAVKGVRDEHRRYLAWHRGRLFAGSPR